jgi:DNA-directed RNA polymerase specialized sigma subunit
MRVETYLSQGRLLNQRINYQLKKLGELKNAACSLPAVTIRKDKVQSSTDGDAPFVRALIRVEEMEEKIKREIDMLADLKEEIMGMIGQVDSEELQMVLIYRYLEGMTWEEIGDLIYADRTTVKRWHRKAIEQIVLPEEQINKKS